MQQVGNFISTADCRLSIVLWFRVDAMTDTSCFSCLYADVKFLFAQQALFAAEAGRQDAERTAVELRVQFGAAVAAKERLELEVDMITKRCVVSHPVQMAKQ